MKRQFLWPLVVLSGAASLWLVVIGQGRLSGQTVNPASDATANSASYVYRLQLDGATVAEYTDCSGLGSSNDIIEVPTVGTTGGDLIEKSPGALRWHGITLRCAGISADGVWSWRHDLEAGNTDQAFRDGAIVVLTNDSQRQWVAEWSFHRGWAQSLTLDGGMEELVIVHEGLERTEGGSIPHRP